MKSIFHVSCLINLDHKYLKIGFYSYMARHLIENADNVQGRSTNVTNVTDGCLTKC